MNRKNSLGWDSLGHVHKDVALQKDTGYSMFKESCRLLISSGCRARLLEDMMSSSACNFVYIKKFSVNELQMTVCCFLS